MCNSSLVQHPSCGFLARGFTSWVEGTHTPACDFGCGALGSAGCRRSLRRRSSQCRSTLQKPWHVTCRDSSPRAFPCASPGLRAACFRRLTLFLACPWRPAYCENSGTPVSWEQDGLGVIDIDYGASADWHSQHKSIVHIRARGHVALQACLPTSPLTPSPGLQLCLGLLPRYPAQPSA